MPKNEKGQKVSWKKFSRFTFLHWHVLSHLLQPAAFAWSRAKKLMADSVQKVKSIVGLWIFASGTKSVLNQEEK